MIIYISSMLAPLGYVCFDEIIHYIIQFLTIIKSLRQGEGAWDYQ